jgi:sarcosine oxidase / L-pipecolate oxidase
MLQLSEQEAKAYRDCPTVLDLGSGFYIFPVSASKLVT